MAPALRTATTAWRRPRVRRTVQVGTVGAVLVATLVPLQAAQAAPERVLQSVAVQLGPDGSISSIQSQAIRKAGGTDTSVDDAAFDPAADAEKLPVRVQTAYRVGGRSGTDLRDIEGEEGRVVIDVTVSNTTVRPQLVEYDTGSGTTARDYALVGAPLTVVGSVALATDDLTQVITTDDTAPDQVTNGVVSPAPTGGSQVQWAAMLAPPRLAPSTTFRLVQQTDSFEVPTFDFSVQPGLRTDTSLAGLLDTAFSDADGGSLDLQSRTIELVGDVNVALSEAGSVLGGIQTTLDSSAGDLADRTIRDLQAGRGAVEENLTSAVEQLDALDEEVGETLTSNSEDVGDTLSSSIDDVRAQLGDPNDTSKINLGFTGGCQKQIPRGQAGGDVLYRVRLVAAQLDALATATGDCADDLKQDLRETIGVLDEAGVPRCTTDPTLPADEPRSALCALQDASGTLQTNITLVKGLGDSLDDAEYVGATAELKSKIEALGAALADIQDVYVDEEGNLTPEYEQLANLSAAITSAQTQVSQLDLGSLRVELNAIGDIARTQVSAVGNTRSAQTRSAELLKQLETCAAPPVNDPGCLAAKELARGLADDVNKIRNAWDGPGGVLSHVDTMNNAIGSFETARDNISAELAALASSVSTDGSAGNIGDFIARVRALYSQFAFAPPAGCGIDIVDNVQIADLDLRSPDGEPGAFNDLITAYFGVKCASLNLDGDVDGIVAPFLQSLEDGDARVKQGITDTDQARDDAEDSVDAITQQLGNRTRQQGEDLVGSVARGIRGQRVQLNAAEQQALKGLDALTKRAVERIGSQVGQSNRDLESTNTALQRDLTSVLLDLGTRDGAGSGLLGTLATSARRTGLSNSNLAEIGQQASAFSGVRGQQLADMRLQQEQTDQSLDLLSRYPGFGLDLPRGSSVTTVYTFHLGSK